jgi:hypothetical protein
MKQLATLVILTAAVLGILFAINIINKWNTDSVFWNRLMFNQKPITVPIQTFNK